MLRLAMYGGRKTAQASSVDLRSNVASRGRLPLTNVAFAASKTMVTCRDYGRKFGEVRFWHALQVGVSFVRVTR